ncbi:hypothetical protein [Chitinophaga sp. sic0106]|uniref:hypothetical protein n=1 Tax=Chitinophaga sp. sic0106 TaxID=2854785 RepID=UPI001C4429B7|nr:hypothetical protein [Chitinophaga sp. sic0106]MBV7531268.1 hypothetical protein [Chitinophaga sp. sic0106]
MIKKSLLLLGFCLLIVPVAIFAQTPVIEKSTGFEEPEDGASKLILLKNGNTMLIHFTKNDGIETTVYNAKHKKSGSVQNEIKSWRAKKMATATLEGLFDINGDVVAFMTQMVNRTPTLFRLTFDGKTGKLKSEDVVSETNRLGLGAGYSMLFGQVDEPGFIVRKDPESEYYAVATYNSFTHDKNERVKVTHYSPEHQVLNEAYYESPENKFKYLKIEDMYVRGDEFVFVTSFSYNTITSGGKQSRVMVSRLTKGEKEFKSEYLSGSSSTVEPLVALKYQPANKQLYMLSALSAKSLNMDYTMWTSKVNFVLKLNVIDPVALKIGKEIYINHPGLNNYAKDRLGYKKHYYGVIQDFRIHDDGSLTLMFEELDAQIKQSEQRYFNPTGNNVGFSNVATSTASVSTGRMSAVMTKLGDMGIVRLSAEGKELPGSYAIAKRQMAYSWLNPYYVYERSNGGFNFKKGFFGKSPNDGFFSFDCVYSGDKLLTIFNDNPQNMDEDNESYKGKKTMKFMGDANTVLAWEEGGTVKKIYLFGDPGKKDEARFCKMEMNAFSADKKTLATMLIERKGKEKRAYLAWMQF